jgi:hypothetical protein
MTRRNPTYCGKPKGYRIEYPDGRRCFRCGQELIEIMDIDGKSVLEIIDLLKRQADFMDMEWKTRKNKKLANQEAA